MIAKPLESEVPPLNQMSSLVAWQGPQGVRYPVVLLDEGGGDPRLARDDVQELPELAVLVDEAHETGPAASRQRSTSARVALVP